MTAYTRNHLAGDLARCLNVSTYESKRVARFIIDQLSQAVADGRKVEFRGFGIFIPHVRKRKVGRNPLHPEAGVYAIPARKVVRFRVSKGLDRRLNPA